MRQYEGREKELKLNALLLNDCFDEEWINQKNPINVYEFYGRVLDFTRSYHYDIVIGVTNTHHWFKEKYPNLKMIGYDENISDYLPKHSNVLVAGAAWNACLHKNAFCFQKLLEKSFNVYSHPKIVDSYMKSTQIVNKEMFLADGWHPVNGLFLFHHYPETQNENE